ncbi:MAG: methionyl-tRNA formyltransferase [Actinomycetales bacterium]|nr:methionyl-tRNA formyltransferase [Actinomycetales bacterium]MCP4892764.1 methionyl-tRNA formyltransferase [Actinomycetales bacterium]
MRVVFAGTPDVAVASLVALEESSHEVVGVLTRPDAPAGRGRRLRASPVKMHAEEAGIEVRTPSNLQREANVLGDWAPDVVAVVAYGLMVPAPLLTVPRCGWVNAHFSLLPVWRGAAPVQHAIGAGQTHTGVTTFSIDEGLDTGPILMRSDQVSIEDREDAGALLARLAIVGATLLVSTIDAMAGGELHPAAQDPDGVSLAPRISSDDARVNWSGDVLEVDRWIRACTPDPGAWTVIDGQRVNIGTPQAVVVDESASPGVIHVEKSQVTIGARGGFIVLGEVQATGKKTMGATDWARGYRGEMTRAT